MDSQDGQDFVIIERKDIEQYDTKGIVPLSRKEIANIRQWLQPTDYLADSSEYKKHLNSHLRGTGAWIERTEAYQKWHDSPNHGALWIKAIAGAGKSVLAATIAAKLASRENVPVLFFFFRQIVATNHHPQSLARDFIAQLLDYSPVLQATMKKHMDNRHSIDGLSTSALWADLTEALLSMPKLYCVVDALDEMDIDQESFFEDLLSLGKLKPELIKLLMTSRPLPRIEQVLKDPSVLQVRLEQRLVDKDIAVYVDYRLSQRADFNDELRSAVKEEIGNKSQGSFLYARLMMDELTSHFDQMVPEINSIHRSLDMLPVTLEDMYNGILLDHSLRSSVAQDLQVTILRWVTHSSRPLRLLELATMLDSLNDEKKGKDTKAVVRAACGPLLEILEDETVSVIHHSFTEFLIDSSREGRKAPGSVHPQFPVIGLPTTHRILAVTCLRYLTSGCLSNWEVKPRKEDDDFYSHPMSKQQEINMQYPFLRYAVGNLFYHIRKMGRIDAGLCSMLDTFMQNDNQDFKAFLDLAWQGPQLTETSPIHVAAWAGLTAYTRRLVHSSLSPNVLDAQQRSPLSWAAGNGHTDVVALLLENGAKADSDDSVGLKPLHYAARANHHAVVKMLLAAGVSPLTPKTKEYPGRWCGNAPTTTGETPLLYACQSGNAETVREMMPYLEANDLNDSLCIASRCGKTQVVNLLLTSPKVSADPPDAEDTPLFLASAGLHLEIMRSLLKNGADPMRRSKNYGYQEMRFFSLNDLGKKEEPGPTPFHAICGASRDRRLSKNVSDEGLLRKCFQTLSEAGCDINATDNHGKTPLHYSVVQGDYGRANNVLSIMLLEAGADPMMTDKEGKTPLHLLQLYKDSAPTVEALIAHGADINARAKDGRTPIHTAVDCIHSLDIKVMLPYVKDWSVKDSQGDTPLHIIFSKSYDPDKVLDDLVEAGADLNARNLKGEVPLHVLREVKFMGENFLPSLLKVGVDLEAKDHEGRTILLRTLMGIGGGLDTAATARDLLTHGSKIDTRDHDGNGVLHAVCRKSANAKLLRMLIDAGADPHAVNHAGNSILHEIAIDYKSNDEEQLGDAIRLLLENDLSPMARNNLGQTPLHFVFGSLPAQLLANKKDPLDLFLNPEFRTLIDAADNNGVRPIHQAATISEGLVSRLLDLGADSTASTNEGRTILHVAARARQSNIIGLVLDHFSAINRPDIIDYPDSGGRTALHDACRSGRPESVALLLKAGANPNAKGKSQYTPLHTCAEFEEENLLWTAGDVKVGRRDVHARSVLLSDRSRPESRAGFNQIATENYTARVRDIIRLLIAHGADVDALCQGNEFAIDLALRHDSSEMANELLPYLKKAYAKAKEEERPWSWRGRRVRDTFREEYVTLRSKYLPSILEEEMKGDGTQKIRRCDELLALREFDAITRLPGMGVDFTPNSKELHQDFLSTLVKGGYSEFLETLGTTVKVPWANGLLNPGNKIDCSWTQYSITPYLLTAVQRQLPNLEVVKILVEKFGADVNLQPLTIVYQGGGGYVHLPGATALHVVSCGTHWWRTEAVKYLLSKGADPELRNEKGQTALHIAVSNDHLYGTYRQRQTTRLLLEHGADPNVMDNNGLTCLNKAIHDVELVALLIKHGADISLGEKPVLFSAITAQDLPTIKTLLGTGADCNTRQKKSENPQQNRMIGADRVEEHEFYPVHYAASHKFDNIHDRDKTAQIVKVLLEHSADPYLNFKDDACILHHILSHGGLLQPFLDIPGLDLERRDPQGRTLLLSACSSSRGTNSPTNFSTAGFDRTPIETRQKALTDHDPTAAQTLFQMGANLNAVDNEGNNALHLLIQATPHNDEQYKKTIAVFLSSAPSLVHQKNAKGYTPYHYTTPCHRISTARELIAAGADPLEVDPEGNTSLHHLAAWVCSSDDTWASVFKEHIDLGVDINTRNKKGETAVFNYFKTGCHWGELKEARSNFGPFEEAGADLGVRNKEGEGLLHVVAKRVYGNMIVRSENAADVVDAFVFLMEKGLVGVFLRFPSSLLGRYLGSIFVPCNPRIKPRTVDCD